MKKAVKIILIVLVILAVIAGIAFAALRFGKKAPAGQEGEVTAVIEDFTEDINIFETAKKNPDRYTLMLQNSFAMDKKEIDNFLKQPEEWLAYNVFLKVSNSNEQQAAFTKAVIEENGKDGLYISEGVGGSVVSIPAGSEGSIVLTVLLHSPDPSMDAVREMVENKNISLSYALIEGDSLSDIPEDNLQEVRVG